MGGRGDIWLALLEGRVAGGIICLHDATHTHYFHGVVDRACKAQPAAALFDHAIAQACGHGRRGFNMAGVNKGNEGLIRFKRSWGAEPRSYAVVTFEGRLARKFLKSEE